MSCFTKTTLFLVALLSMRLILACSCVMGNIKEEVESSGFIAEGIIIEKEYEIYTFNEKYDSILKITYDSKINPSDLYFSQARYTLLVNHTYKGIEQDTIILYSDPTGTMCGFEFDVGKKYIIYANTHIPYELSVELKKVSNYPEYRTGLCTKTTDYSKEEIKQLRQALRKK